MTDTIESLRQQLAECQAREKARINALAELVSCKDMKDRGFGAHDTESEDEYMRRKPLAWKSARTALAMPSDSAALDEAIKQAKREFSEKLAVKFGKTDADFIRRMAPAPDATP